MSMMATKVIPSHCVTSSLEIWTMPAQMLGQLAQGFPIIIVIII
jgi:hypothetical protein